MPYDPSNPLSILSNASNLYQGANAGGTQGAARALTGSGGLLTAGANYLQAPQLQGIGTALGGAGNAAGIAAGIEQGGVSGYGGAAINAGQLAGRAGLGSPQMNQDVGDLGNALGIYKGIQQGGVSGYGGAAINAAKLGSSLGAFGGASGAVGQAAGAAAIPLDLYNEIKGWQSGATGSDALAGAETGAAVGSVIPVIGTIAGGLIGGAAGAISSAFGPGKVDPENASFEGYTKAFNSQPDNTSAQALASSVQNPYTVLAGYFDLRPNQVKGSNPIYSTYGRMGEQAFTNDLTKQLSQAQASGQIQAGENPQQAYNQVIKPWIASMGDWNDSNKSAMSALLTQMTSQYLNGTSGQNWQSIGGQTPFASASPSTGSPLSSGTSRGAPSGSAHQSLFNGGGSVMNRPMRVAKYDDGGDVSGGDTSYYGDTDPFNAPTGGPGGYDNLPEVTVTGGLGSGSSVGSSPFDASQFGPPAQPASLSQADLSAIQEDPSAIAAISQASGATGSALSKLLSNPAALGALLGGGLGLAASLGGGSSTPFSFNPPKPFQGSGPMAAGTSQYGNFSATPRQQTNPNINYATQAQTGPQQHFFTPSPQQLSPLAAGSATSPVPSGSGASGSGSTPLNLQQLMAQLQQGQLGNQIVPPGYGSATRAHGGSMHGGGYSPLIVGHQLAGGAQVKGPGNGTSDDIPAMLSDGEYVIPAHVVSALGNGSNDAGAKALDALQARVRLHVGKQMAAGKHPSASPTPEKFMKGAA